MEPFQKYILAFILTLRAYTHISHIYIVSGIQANDHQGINTAFYKGLRLEGKFVSKNVFNLSRKNLHTPEISLLSKGLKFVPSTNKIDRAKLKRVGRIWKEVSPYVALSK